MRSLLVKMSSREQEMVELKEVEVIVEPRRDSSSCAIKSNEDEEIRDLLPVKPRFNAAYISEIFDSMVAEVKIKLLEEYEIMLYDLCRDYSVNLNSKDLDMQSIASLHHLVQLNRSKNVLSYQQASTLEARIEDVLLGNTSALAEYELVKSAMELMSALVVKWGLVQMDLYNYRVIGRCLNVRLLDLAAMNKQLMTLDTVWFIFTINDPPLSALIDEATRQYARVLYRQLLSVLNYLLAANSIADFDSSPSIEKAVAANSKTYAKRFEVEFEPDDKLTPYQKLAKPGMTFFCKKKPEELMMINLKQQIADFELAFRTFEKSLISRLLIAKRPKAKAQGFGHKL
jgi:hypothetical protein